MKVVYYTITTLKKAKVPISIQDKIDSAQEIIKR